MHRRNYLVLLLILLIIAVSGCQGEHTVKGGESEKLLIVATLFPQFDFARAIAGEYADVIMLLPAGLESHTYDPLPADILLMQNADLILYTGPDMEPWAQTIIDSLDSQDGVINTTASITLLPDEHNHDQEPNGQDYLPELEHHHEWDPHVWLNPAYAAVMVEHITQGLCKADPAHAKEYRERCDVYCAQLEQLDKSIAQAVADGDRDTIVFGGRFAYRYFLDRYQLDYVTIYDSCSADVEPSMQKVSQVIDYIKDNGVNYIYYETLSNPGIAASVASECGIELLAFDTAHTIGAEDFNGGVTYLDIMAYNLDNLKKGLAK